MSSAHNLIETNRPPAAGRGWRKVWRCTICGGRWHSITDATEAPCTTPTPGARYEVRFVCEGGLRLAEGAARREPREVFHVVIEALAEMGLHVAGDVSVRPL